MATGGWFERSVDGCDVGYEFSCTRCTCYNEAVCYCRKCDILFCKPCLRSKCQHPLMNLHELERFAQRGGTRSSGVGGKPPRPIAAEEECDRHKGYRLHLYCREHDVVCCELCFTLTHGGCHMNLVSEVAGKINRNKSLKKSRQDLEQFRQTVCTMIENKISRKTELQKNKTNTITSIREYTQKMIEKLQDMEKSALNDVEKHTKLIDEKLQQDLDLCDATVTELNILEQIIIKKEKDKEVCFIKIKKAKQWLESKALVITDIEVNQKSEHEHILFQFTLDVDTLVSKLAILENLKKTCARPYRAVNKREVSVSIKEDIHTCNIEGICQLPDGCILVSDKANKKLKKMDQSYNITSHCSLPGSPFSVCNIEGYEVAVALSNNAIQFVSVGDANMKLTRSLSLNHHCRGVAHHQGKLYVTGGRDGTSAVYVYSLTGSRLNVFQTYRNGQALFDDPWYISTSPNGNTVYVTDIVRGLITFDTHGNVHGTYSSDDLSSAIGVCVTDDGSVFVGGHDSHNVLQVEEKGDNKVTDVVTYSARVQYPNGLSADKDGSRLIIGMLNNNNMAVFELVQGKPDVTHMY